MDMAANQNFHQARANADQEYVNELKQVCDFTRYQSRPLILDRWDNAEYIMY